MRHLAELFTAGIRGRHWCVMARQSIARYADAKGLAREYVADVVALTSPHCTVAENVDRARAYIERSATSSLWTSHRKQLEHWRAAGEIRGLKCRAFALALRGDDSALVIDRHMQRAIGLPERELTQWMLRAAGERIGKLCEVSGLTVCEVQASIWTGVIGASAPTLELMEGVQ